MHSIVAETNSELLEVINEQAKTLMASVVMDEAANSPANPVNDRSYTNPIKMDTNSSSPEMGMKLDTPIV